MGWFCLQAKPQCEIAVANALGDIGVGVYVPTEWRYYAKRRHHRQQEPTRRALALMPGYLFAMAESDAAMFAALATLCRVGVTDQGTMRDALVRHGETIEEHRIARAASPRWQASGVRGVLSWAGIVVEVPQHTIDAIVRLENDLRFKPAPAVAVVFSIGDRVTITIGPGERRSAVVVGKPDSKSKVKIDFGDERRKVPMSSLRLVA